MKILFCLQKKKKDFNQHNCWICDKLFDVGDEKLRDRCHMTGKYRGAAH